MSIVFSTFVFALIIQCTQALSIASGRSNPGVLPSSPSNVDVAMLREQLNTTRHGFTPFNELQNASKVSLLSKSGRLTVLMEPDPIFLQRSASERPWHLSSASLKVEFWILMLTSAMIWIFFVLFAAYNYKSADNYYLEIGPLPDDPAKTRRQLAQFQTQWYECGNDTDICVWSFCCPWIRWAHTMDLLHLFEFGPAFAIFLMLQLVNIATGFVLLGVFFTMLLVHYRQRLRKEFGMQNYGTVAGAIEDWLCLCFCMPCTVAQEAQHVKLAAEMGFPLPACMAEFGGRRKPQPLPVDVGSTSSSQSFHDVNSRGGSCRDSPALPHSEPNVMVFGGLFHHSRSRSSSRGTGYRVHQSLSKARPSRSRSREPQQAGSSSAAAKPKPLANAKVAGLERASSNSSWTASCPRGSWKSQNPMPERLLAPPPARAGEHTEVKSGRIQFVDVLVSLHDDLRAYIFLFAEVGCVGRTSASCRHMHHYIWADRAFWQFYCGPTVNDRLAQPMVCPAPALREAFRKWIFHIDADWAKDFRAFVDQARQSPSAGQKALMLSYARYISSGLMPHDSRAAVAEFTSIMCELLAEYNPEKAEERNAAEAMTAQVECMTEVFSGSQIRSVLSAYDCSLGRAVSAHSDTEPEVEPAWMLSGLGGHEMEEDHEIHAPPGGPETWGDPETNAIMWFG